MNAQHTPGRLRLFDTYADSEIRDDKEKLVAVVLAEKANSTRRLVACWNACDGIDTDDLEVGSVSIIAKLHDAAAKRVLAERDKLLEAQQASMDAQIENEALKARLAKSGVAHRQTVAVLTNALRHIEGVALADEPRDLPGIAQTAREALDHWATQEGEIMNAQHTPGRVKVQHPHAGERGWEIAFEPGIEQVCQNVNEANARRLVACWNACEGIPTEMLEAVCKVPLAAVMLAEQRDELLAALKLAERHCPVGSNAEIIARAAIAKAEGGAA